MSARLIIQHLLDLAIPRECPACQTGYESNASFCPDCDAELTILEQTARCPRCSMPLTIPDAPCAHCLGNGVSPLDTIVSLGILKDPLKTAIHRAKYNHRWSLAQTLTDRLLHRRDVQSLLDNAEVLVPVPLHHQRQRQRGYNQAEVIARRLLKAAPPTLKIAKAADRHRSTETQTHLHSRAQRAENLRDAFVLIDPDSIAGKHIVLVDDVLTTGATLVSLARTLKRAEPASFCAIVIAVADPRGRAFEVI